MALRPRAQTSPNSAIDWTELPATMKWSSTRTSTRAAAYFSVCVRTSSARDGFVAPEGWLCGSSSAELLRSKASHNPTRAIVREVFGV